MNSNKDLYFPFNLSISSSSPSFFSAQSVTNNSNQCGNNIDSSSELSKGFTTINSQGHDQNPSLGFMQLPNFAVDQSQLGLGFGFGYNMPSNFIVSPEYQCLHPQTQNALFQYPLQLNSTTPMRLNNYLLKVPAYQYAPKLPLSSFPVRIDNGLVGKK